MRRGPSRTSACCRRFAGRDLGDLIGGRESLTLRPTFGHAARALRQQLRNSQSLPYKSIGLLGGLPWTRWCLNSWDWRCWRFASSCWRFPARGDRPAAGCATTDRSHFSNRMVRSDPVRRQPPPGGVGPGQKPLSGGNARLEFAARPLTYQRFRQNAVSRSVMDHSWI